jgi:putative ABC transport system permease protein
MTATRRPTSRLGPRDAVALGLLGVRMRRVRSVLSALGISIGIAAIVGVTGISGSSRANVLDELDRLGTNLLTVEPGKDLGGDDAALSADALGMIRRIPLVDVASAAANLSGLTVRRSPYVPAFAGGGIGVRAADPGLLGAVDGRMRSGSFLNAATSDYPVVVLGAKAAGRLGITSAGDGRQVWLAGVPFVVVGILQPVPLVPDLDRAALVGWSFATRRLAFDGHPTVIYVRADQAQVATVRAVLGRTADPAHPTEVLVSRPSDALAARAVTDDAFTYLLIALGLVALLVAAVGIVNVMLIAVLERRTEIGLRRALGATRAHIGTQFLGEAALLAAIGGVAGCVLGSAVTLIFAVANGWRLDLPPWLFLTAIGTAMLVGAVAGAYPAWRASRLPPMEALRGT